MGLIRSFLARGGGARRAANSAAVVQSLRQNGQPSEAASAVSTEEADRLRDAGQYERAAEAYGALLEMSGQRRPMGRYSSERRCAPISGFSTATC
jgi:hypothetical protein